MKKILSIFLLSTLLFNLLPLSFWTFLNNNSFKFNDYSINFVEQSSLKKRRLAKMKQKKLSNLLNKERNK